MSEHIEITAEESGERIDALLARLVPELTRSAAQRLLEEGLVTLGGVPVKKNRRTEPGEVYAALLPEPELPEPEPQDIPLDIVYEDADVVVVNKPRGMVVHPAPGHPDGTLVNALLRHCCKVCTWCYRNGSMDSFLIACDSYINSFTAPNRNIYIKIFAVISLTVHNDIHIRICIKLYIIITGKFSIKSKFISTFWQHIDIA